MATLKASPKELPIAGPAVADTNPKDPTKWVTVPGEKIVAQKTEEQKVVPPENVRRVRRTQPRRYLLQTQLDTNTGLHKGIEALFYMLGKIKFFYRKNTIYNLLWKE